MLTRQKQVILVGAYMRFGLGDAVVDSRSQGGVGVAIDIKFGTLNGPAVSVGWNKIRYSPGFGFQVCRLQITVLERNYGDGSKNSEGISLFKITRPGYCDNTQRTGYY